VTPLAGRTLPLNSEEIRTVATGTGKIRLLGIWMMAHVTEEKIMIVLRI